MLFERLGRLVYRRRKAVLALTAAFVAFAAVWGTAVFGVLDGGGFDDPASESSRAVVALEEDLGRAATDVVVVYRAPEGSDLTVDDPRFEAAVTGALGSLAPRDVAAVTTFWSTGGAPVFVSEDRRATYAAIQLAGADEEARDAAYERIADDLVVPGLTTLRGGQVPLFTDVNTQVSEDIAKAESLSIPLLVVLLILVFGSLAAASLPLAVGMVAILGAFTALRGLSMFGDVSIFSVNIVTMLGLGLAIDYSLFVVSRFREELHHGLSVEDAVVRTVATAGRTVAFSGVTVAVALSALLLFPQNFLRSMGAGGIAAVLVAMVAALTMLPALLGVLGPKVDSLTVPLPWNRRRLAGAADPDSGAWARLARGVMRRPVPGADRRRLRCWWCWARRSSGSPSAAWTPACCRPARRAGSLPRRCRATSQAPVRTTRPTSSSVEPQDPASLPAYAVRARAVPGVTSAEVVRSEGGSALVVVTSPGQPQDQASRDLVVDLRQVPGPQGAEVLVGGVAAAQVDLLDGLGSRLPWVGLFLVATMFLLLFLAFGSVVLPIKAMIMNVLSLSATFGILVWGFQDGNLAGAAGLHVHRLPGGHPADPDLRHGLRPVHGLRGVPALADPRGVGRQSRQHPVGGSRAAAHGSDHHQRRPPVRGRGRSLRHLRHRVHRDDRGRAHGRGARGRHPRTRPARAGDHEAARSVELVGAGADGALVGQARRPRGWRVTHDRAADRR